MRMEGKPASWITKVIPNKANDAKNCNVKSLESNLLFLVDTLS